MIANRKANSHYCITCEGWIGVVCNISDEYIEVKEASAPKNFAPFTVLSDCFDLLEPVKFVQDDEFLSMMFDVGEIKCLSN